MDEYGSPHTLRTTSQSPFSCLKTLAIASQISYPDATYSVIDFACQVFERIAQLSNSGHALRFSTAVTESSCRELWLGKYLGDGRGSPVDSVDGCGQLGFETTGHQRVEESLRIADRPARRRRYECCRFHSSSIGNGAADLLRDPYGFAEKLDQHIRGQNRTRTRYSGRSAIEDAHAIRPVTVSGAGVGTGRAELGNVYLDKPKLTSQKIHMEATSIPHLAAMIPTEADAYGYLEQLRWPNGPVCPHCGNAPVCQADVRHLL